MGNNLNDIYDMGVSDNQTYCLEVYTLPSTQHYYVPYLNHFAELIPSENGYLLKNVSASLAPQCVKKEMIGSAAQFLMIEKTFEDNNLSWDRYDYLNELPTRVKTFNIRRDASGEYLYFGYALFEVIQHDIKQAMANRNAMVRKKHTSNEQYAKAFWSFIQDQHDTTIWKKEGENVFVLESWVREVMLVSGPPTGLVGFGKIGVSRI